MCEGLKVKTEVVYIGSSFFLTLHTICTSLHLYLLYYLFTPSHVFIHRKKFENTMLQFGRVLEVQCALIRKK